MIRKSFFVCLFVILCSLPVFAQEKTATSVKKPNFNGVWIPQVEKEKKPDASSKDWTNVLIEQSEQDIKFTLIYPQSSKTSNLELTYFTDERGETNPAMVYYFVIANNKLPEKEIKSSTKWDGQALVTVHKMVTYQNPVTITTDLTMRWELSSDARTLTRTTRMSNYAATYVQKTKDGEKLVSLPVSGATDSEFKDSYILLEPKK